ncbi:L-alanine-DL-glutamate epimerase-like enolase superfamily enzyme [Dyadobacter sp. BE34]|uniref:glucarate dehydratase n=1 Tax=Dyadobacter fermentans TaxID=94254 RepID=A0ABU1R466_9BACT|nr:MULTISPECIES: mandelate racemase/muconate lactonizing enzyme family protein [Dyadobacter]MDR6808212.1 L-alanine-DL-glutamate epimerase-like enolase superfamily enzyme [Dyadobacter fermentans]MDR7045972.1 L-alanine-DL-glutamate epimerase-like enolase superfamily enzyme [Dyadobacter sp. BE242]MDR7200285.1 L-alanine-DL-glutamate epimerase-like enolase superfamily enzyme [Dyadobacter sp. BE34]MDR7218245.1 L-alanine-DL-glutamate epimerase-like enolase superfamily enzyme [Dyadobacter sp. BE31]MDR
MTTIVSLRATEVIVPAKAGSLNSETVLDKDTAFAQKFLTGESWTEFANQPKWIIEMTLANGLTGVGETYRSASGELIREALQEFVGKDVLKLNWRRLPVTDQRIYEAFESCVLDLVGKLLHVPVHQLLGGAYRNTVNCMGWTGRRTPEDAAQKAFEAMQKGHKVFKFKCSDEDPVRLWTEEIKKQCGDGIKVLLDPNQRWNDVKTTMKLMDGVEMDVMLGLEDPILHADVEGFKYLKKHLGIPLYRHISLPYTQDIRDMITFVRADAADGYNFNGSAYNCVLLAEIAHLEGKPCWRGSEVDLGISETMGLHIAAASINCTIPSDIFGELVRVDDLLTDPIVFENGAAKVPQGHGLGITLDQDALRKYQTGKILTAHS